MLGHVIPLLSLSFLWRAAAPPPVAPPTAEARGGGGGATGAREGGRGAARPPGVVWPLTDGARAKAQTPEIFSKAKLRLIAI